MIVLLDTKCLIRWSSHREPDTLDRARLEHLLATISLAKGRVILPAPVIAEFLVHADAGTADWLASIEKKSSVKVGVFDRRAALECALIDRAAISAGDKKGGRKDPWQRIKVDRQIVAIARVESCTQIVTDDAGLTVTAKSVGLSVLEIGDLELPDSARQRRLPYDGDGAEMPPSL